VSLVLASRVQPITRSSKHHVLPPELIIFCCRSLPQKTHPSFLLRCNHFSTEGRAHYLRKY
jgi:hypothetical protein